MALRSLSRMFRSVRPAFLTSGLPIRRFDRSLLTTSGVPLLAAEPVTEAVATGAIVKATAASTPFWVTALQVLPGFAAQVVFLAPLEAMRTIKANKTTGNFPVVPYVSMAINGVLWMVYGGLVGQPTIWVTNISGAILGSYYWYTFSQYCPPSFPMTPYYAVGAGALAGIGTVAYFCEPGMAINILGFGGNLAVVAMFGGPLVAIKTVLKDKNTASLPVGMCIATFVNCTLWTSYGLLVVHDPYVWFCNSLGLASSIAQLALFLRFGLPPKK